MKLTVSGQVFLEVGFRDRGDQRPELLCPNGIARFFDADRKGPGPGAYNLTQVGLGEMSRNLGLGLELASRAHNLVQKKHIAKIRR
uniref:Uncharacterized protein n=1 Tax=Macaca fascicularis TaxID=9541 RepID=A0A7N9D4S0_MACFA